ncbi:MAG: class I SAM-dependent methyltransferase [Gemmatimonadaceae bacterium]|nr:class I SAM-dependent methyltransferase [Gemmatimonadaceae bacterium]
MKRTFEEAGRRDPLYAVLTDHAQRDRKWDRDAFFETGEREIATVVQYLGTLSTSVARARALDFGCGVGRLTLALSRYFEMVVGVDISSSMVTAAEAFNTQTARVRYIVNDGDDLRQFGDASFDFIYSNLTLQHVPPAAALSYIAEFVRLLRPGGVACFQLCIGPLILPGTWSAFMYKVRREWFRRFWKRLRGRIPYEMHFVARSQVEESVLSAGGRIIDVVDVSKVKNGSNLRFAVSTAA